MKERGNILFLILLAIVLFAALSYAVTNGTRVSDNGGMSKEAAESAAADILNWTAQVDVVVQRMRMIKGYSIEDISFRDNANKDQTGGADIFHNTNCGGTDCRVFYPDGGGATSRFFEKYAYAAANVGDANLRMPGHHTYMMGQVANIGTPANDLLLRIDYLALPVCKALNRKLGLSECPAVGQTGSIRRFEGAVGPSIVDAASAYKYSADVTGQTNFCSCSGNAGSFLHVVIER